ncbi:hypothetical protein FHR99_000076 [Litorivivens lipolytica]|uniref:Uncharacterized protein n=1 Tax=Litorivivens lipolytica TaxID=1524264 RepID=A0A7W4W201_9GAMM|nr:hypothetical protein [Litorivivens lipolytica]
MRRIYTFGTRPLSTSLKLGVYSDKSERFSMPASFNLSAPTAVTETGTSPRDSVRFWAVTRTSTSWRPVSDRTGEARPMAKQLAIAAGFFMLYHLFLLSLKPCQQRGMTGWQRIGGRYRELFSAASLSSRPHWFGFSVEATRTARHVGRGVKKCLLSIRPM